MKKADCTRPAARGGVTILCFLIVIAGQLWLLRGTLGEFFRSAPYIIELLFCIAMVAGIVLCFFRPMGWGGKGGCIAALLAFVLYLVVSIINYDTFAPAYLAGMNSQYPSSGGAMVGLKLTLALIGVTAGIPTIAPIDGHEYSARMREKVERQNAQWSAASVKGAQSDLNATVERLRASLSEEEMAALLEQLQQSKPERGAEPAGEGAASHNGEKRIDPEDWRGWGGGM